MSGALKFDKEEGDFISEKILALITFFASLLFSLGAVMLIVGVKATAIAIPPVATLHTIHILIFYHPPKHTTNVLRQRRKPPY